MNITDRRRMLRRTEYYNPTITSSADDMSARMCKILKSLRSGDRSTVVLCIGTDRATGDALGPLVGSLLSNSQCAYRVYGTLQHPVHALNLNDTINKKLPAIGDLSITGIVNLSGKPGLSLLQSTRLYTVNNMAHYIADVIMRTEAST